MKCDEVNVLMQHAIDHESDESETQALYEHLATCQDCRLFFERLKRLHLNLEQLPMVEPPFSIVDSILPQLELIKPEKVKKRSGLFNRFSTRSWGLIAATVALVVGAFAFMDREEKLPYVAQDIRNEEFSISSNRNSGTMGINQFNQYSETDSAKLKTSDNELNGEFKSISIEPLNPELSNEPDLDSIEKEVVIDFTENGDGELGNLLGEGSDSSDPTNETGGEEQYGIAINPDPEGEEQAIAIGVRMNIDEEMTEINSPDGKLVVLFNGELLEVKEAELVEKAVKDQPKELYLYKVKDGQYIMHVNWLDSTTLEIEIQASDTQETIIVDVIKGLAIERNPTE